MRVNIVLLDSDGVIKLSQSFIEGVDPEIQFIKNEDFLPTNPPESYGTSYYYFQHNTSFDVLEGDKLYIYTNADTAGVSLPAPQVHSETKLRSIEDPSYLTEWDFTLRTIAPETTSNYIEIEDAITSIIERITKGNGVVTINKSINWSDDVKLMSGFDVRGVSDEVLIMSFKEIMDAIRSLWGYGYAIRSNQEIYIAHVSKFFDDSGFIDLTDWSTDAISELTNIEYQKSLVEYGFSQYAKDTISSEEEQAEGGQLGFQTIYTRNTPLENSLSDQLVFLCPFPADGFLLEFQRRKNELFKEGQSASEDDSTF